MLPHETEVSGEIRARYRAQITAMTDLHNAVVGMLAVDGWRIGRPGLDRAVVETMFGLLTKACKTFRGIQILCERGLYEDASALVRVLLETTAAVVFILKKKPRERARIYHAHGAAQQLKMLNEWRITPGLKLKATRKIIQQANAAIAQYVRMLPPGTDFKHHWSGKRNLQEAMRDLGGDVVYATLYRYTSWISHAADFGAQFDVGAGSSDPLWRIEPQVRGFETPSYAARQLLWNLASRIDTRLGLGFSAALAPYKLTRADVRGGKV